MTLHLPDTSRTWIDHTVAASRIRDVRTGDDQPNVTLRVNARHHLPHLTGTVIGSSARVQTGRERFKLEIRERPGPDGWLVEYQAWDGDQQARLVPPFDELVTLRSGPEIRHTPMILQATFGGWFGSTITTWHRIENGSITDAHLGGHRSPDLAISLDFAAYLSVRAGEIAWRDALASESAAISAELPALITLAGVFHEEESLAALDAPHPAVAPASALCNERGLYKPASVQSQHIDDWPAMGAIDEVRVYAVEAPPGWTHRTEGIYGSGNGQGTFEANGDDLGHTVDIAGRLTQTVTVTVLPVDGDPVTFWAGSGPRPPELERFPGVDDLRLR